MPGYNTSPSGLSAAGKKGDAALSAAKAGSPKSGDATEAPHKGAAGVASNEINKAAAPKPPGSTSDTGRMKP